MKIKLNKATQRAIAKSVRRSEIEEAANPPPSTPESVIGHGIISRLFELPITDMGAGLRIMYPKPAYLTVEERDLIVKAIHAYVR